MTTFKTSGDGDLSNQKSNLSSSSSSSSSDSDSDSSDSSSSNSSKTKPNKTGKRSGAQFSVTSTGNAGLRLIIATIPRNDRTKTPVATKAPKTNKKKHSSAKKVKSASSSNKSDCSCCSDDEDDSDSDSSVAVDGKKEGEVAEKTKANRGGSTSSGARTDSCESDSSEELLELNPDDLDAILLPDNQSAESSAVAQQQQQQPSSLSSAPTTCKPNPLTKTLQLEAENDGASSSDMEMPAAINAAILRVESGSDAESTKTSNTTTQYTSSLLRDFVAKAQNLDDSNPASQASSSPQPQLVKSLKISRDRLQKDTDAAGRARNHSNSNRNKKTEIRPPTPPAPAKKPRGRPKSQPAASATPLSESPDSGILSTAQSPAQSPKVGGKKLKSTEVSKKDQPEPVRKPQQPTSSKSVANSLTKYNIASLEKSLYANERVLYPPRGKKKGPGRPSKQEKPQQPQPTQSPETLDPVWRKIDLNRKFREPCLDGYKSDGAGTGIGGAQSLCCSKMLAAKSGYVSDYGGVSGLGRSKSSSGYKTDHSSKSRRKSSGGYRSDFSVKAKSCGYRSDCSTRHRKKVRRKRRKKVNPSTPTNNKPTTPVSVNELDILQLAGLTLGSTSESEDSTSSRDSIVETAPKVPRKYAKTPPPPSSSLNFNGYFPSAGNKMKTSRSRTPAPIATSSPTTPRTKEKAVSKKHQQKASQEHAPIINNNNNNNNNNKKRTFGKGFLLNNLCERVTKRISGQDGSGSGTEKSVASFQTLSNKANQKNRRKSEALFGGCDAPTTSSKNTSSGTSFLDKIKESTQLKLDADKPGNLRHRRISTMSRCSSKSTRSRHHIRKRRRRRLKSSSSVANSILADEKVMLEIEELSESLKLLSMINHEKTVEAKQQQTPTTKSTGTVQATSKRVTKKRKTSDNSTAAIVAVINHHVDSPSTALAASGTNLTAGGNKRRTKKSATPQGPDEHKLPLKKRHYLLTPGEKPENHHHKSHAASSEHHHSPKVHHITANPPEEKVRKGPHYEQAQIEQFRVHVAEAIEATITRFSSSSTPTPTEPVPVVHTPTKDSTKAITPKKRHLLKTPAAESATPTTTQKQDVSSMKTAASVVIDLSITESIQMKTQTQTRKCDIITRKKNRLEGLLSKIAPATTPSPTTSRSPSTYIIAENSSSKTSKSVSAATNQSQRASVIKTNTTKAAQVAMEMAREAESNSNPPPGVFEPSVDLELQIPTSTITPSSVVTKTEMLDTKDGVVVAPPTSTPKVVETQHKKGEKVVEKSPNRAGGQLLVKKKRRKVNRTGFPSVKKKKKSKPSDKENDGGDGEEEEKPSPLILLDTPPIADLTKETTASTAASGSKEVKNCDRVPKDGETTATFIERNSRPRLSIVSLERLQGKVTTPAVTIIQPTPLPEKRQLREKSTKENGTSLAVESIILTPSVKKRERDITPAELVTQNHGKTSSKKSKPDRTSEVKNLGKNNIEKIKERISKAPRDLSSDNEPLINLVTKVTEPIAEEQPLSKFMSLRETRKSRSLRSSQLVEPTDPIEPVPAPEVEERKGKRKRTRNLSDCNTTAPKIEEPVTTPLLRRSKTAIAEKEKPAAEEIPPPVTLPSARKRSKTIYQAVAPIVKEPEQQPIPKEEEEVVPPTLRKRSKPIFQAVTPIVVPAVVETPRVSIMRKELKVEISRLNIQIPHKLFSPLQVVAAPPVVPVVVPVPAEVLPVDTDNTRITVKIPIAKLRPYQKSLLSKLKFDIFAALDKNLVTLPLKRSARAIKATVAPEPVVIEKTKKPEPVVAAPALPELSKKDNKKVKLNKKTVPVKEELVPVPANQIVGTETALDQIKAPLAVDCNEHEPLPEKDKITTAVSDQHLLMLDESSLSSSDKEGKPTGPAKKERKKYLPAGLFSDFYKGVESTKLAAKTSANKQPNVLDKVTLPPPAYCEKYFRQTQQDFELPFDLWHAHDNGKLPGRDLVPSWNFRKIRTNVYGDVRSQPAFDHQPCSCKLLTSCREDCLNRMVYTECMPETCPCGDKCQNQKIQRHDYAPGIERFMTDKKGFGVRTRQDIRKGTFISEYLGEVVTEREFKDRMQTLYVNDTHHYCLNLDGGLVIDGHRMGSECRFVNHSCSPNCEIQKWSVNGLFRMALFALRDIRADEELTYDYNFSLFNPAEGQPCRCDTPQCRGVIGGKSQRINQKPAAEFKAIEGGKSSKTRSGRPRKRQARKDQPQITFKYGASVPPFHPPTPKERAMISEHHCFLLRNLNKMKKQKGRVSPALSTGCGGGGGATSSSPARSTSLSAQIAALRVPRNIRTRGLASVAQDPEVEKTAKMAVVLREICAEIGSKKNESGTTLIAKLQIPSKKKCPLYHEKIPQPIDLSQIEGNIEKGVYKLPKAFDDDVQKMFQNAVKYYGNGSAVSTAVTALKAFYTTIKQNVAEKLVEILGHVDHIKDFATLATLPLDPNTSYVATGDEEDEIRCICGMPRDEGVMIQCSRCLVWQHIECTKADADAEDFMCERCEPREVNYEITMEEFTDEGYQYYLTLMRGKDLQIRQGDTVYVLRDIPMTPEQNASSDAPRKHTYETIGSVDFSECDIFRVERLWKDKEGKRFVFGHHYLRPHETFHEPTRKFYPNEVLRVPLYEVVQIELIIDRCWVLDPQTFCKGRPLAASEPHVYICELRVDKSASAFSKISQKHAYQVCTQRYAFHKFEQKLKIYRTYAPHDLGSIVIPKEKKKRKPEDNPTTNTRKSTAPIVQLLPPPPKTLNEKRNRLENTLNRLMTQLRLRLNDSSASMDLSYLLTGRGARSRRTNNPTPVPV